MGGKPNRMDVKEFRDLGYLQEINRRLLHPLGLALEVVVEQDGTHRLGGIHDFRDDEEGIRFTEVDAEKVARLAKFEGERRQARVAALGYWVQPVLD